MFSVWFIHTKSMRYFHTARNEIILEKLFSSRKSGKKGKSYIAFAFLASESDN